jgi:hypothetical protein
VRGGLRAANEVRHEIRAAHGIDALLALLVADSAVLQANAAHAIFNCALTGARSCLCLAAPADAFALNAQRRTRRTFCAWAACTLWWRCWPAATAWCRWARRARS